MFLQTGTWIRMRVYEASVSKNLTKMFLRSGSWIRVRVYTRRRIMRILVPVCIRTRVAFGREPTKYLTKIVGSLAVLSCVRRAVRALCAYPSVQSTRASFCEQKSDKKC